MDCMDISETKDFRTLSRLSEKLLMPDQKLDKPPRKD